MDQKILNFNFTLQETNLILQCLGKQPYEAVSELINRILSDAKNQIQVEPPVFTSNSGTTPDDE